MFELSLVVIGAALGYAGARYQEWLKIKRAKRTLATGVLSELRWLEGILHQIYDYGPASYYDALEHPMIEATLPHLMLFQPDTAERLSHFHNLLRDTRALMNRYREAPDPVIAQRQQFVHFTKAKAYYAATAVATLAAAMRKEGGRMPPPIEEKPITTNTLPPLPGRTFDSFSGDE